jgi:CubicO group peptidase (beta-lactamase class C family)
MPMIRHFCLNLVLMIGLFMRAKTPGLDFKSLMATLIVLFLASFGFTAQTAPPTAPIATTQTPVTSLSASSSSSPVDLSQSTVPLKQSAARPRTNRAKAKPIPTAASQGQNNFVGPIIAPINQTQGYRPMSSAEVETFSDSLIRSIMTRDHIAGVSVAVIQGDQILLLKGYGYDRLSPARRVDPQTSLFRLGSVSKVMTWIIARQEIETGRIALNAPLSTYLPETVNPKDRRYADLTFRALMSHSGGFEDTSLGHVFSLNPRDITNPYDYARRHPARRVNAPFVNSSYSNFGVSLASLALLQTTKAKDVPSLMEARLLGPMGLSHTTFREPYSIQWVKKKDLPQPMSNRHQDLRSRAYVWNGSDFEERPFESSTHMSAALGGSASAGDMAKLMRMMLNGGQLDGRQYYNQGSNNAFKTPMLNRPEGFNGWASGLMIHKGPFGETIIGHSGETLWTSSQMIIIPEQQLGIFIAANTQTGNKLSLNYPRLLLDHFRSNLDQTIEQKKAILSPEAYKAIDGHYVSSRRAYGGLEGAVTRLVNTVELKSDSQGRLRIVNADGVSIRLPSTKKDLFIPQSKSDWDQSLDMGAIYIVRESPNGRVLGFKTEAGTAFYERINPLFKPSLLKFSALITVLGVIILAIKLLRGTQRLERTSEAQERATLISLSIGVALSLSIIIFWSYWNGVEKDPLILFTQWPNGMVRLASFFAGLGSIGILYQLFTLHSLWTEDRRFNDGWSVFEKSTHTGLIAVWSFYCLLVGLWGGLNPFSW